VYETDIRDVETASTSEDYEVKDGKELAAKAIIALWWQFL
jgi:hypothetical protein